MSNQKPERSLRILVAQNVPNHRRGGMSRMLGSLHDRVATDGHSVEFFTSDQVPKRFAGRFARFTFPWLLWRHCIAAAQRGQPYDVVNVHEPSGAVLAFGRRAAGNPLLVVTSHGVEDRGWAVTREDARLGRVPLSLKTRVWHPLTVLTQSRIGLSRADHVCCLNEEDRAFLRRKYRLTEDQVTRLFPAADQVYLDAFRRRDYTLADRLLVFGTWLPRKGASDIVDAFAMLAERRPRLKLVMMGTGLPSEAVLSAFPEQLRDRVEIAGPAAEADLAEQMLHCAVYIIPSLFEGTPQTLMETMATGMPAVGTATCGMKDVIRNGENGMLIPVRRPEALAAATEQLLADRELREQLGRRAHADVAANYTWDRVAAPLRAVYQGIANNLSRTR